MKFKLIGVARWLTSNDYREGKTTYGILDAEDF